MEWVKLCDVAEVIMGQSPKSEYCNDNKEGLPFYQGVSDFGEIFPVPAKYCTEPKKMAEIDDILIGVRAPVGDLNISNSKCCIGRGVAAIRANEKFISKKYLFYFLKTQKQYFEINSTGSTFKAINKSVLSETLVPIIDINKQKIIEDILERIENIIRKRKEQIQAYDDLIESLFFDMLQYELMSDKIEYSKLGDLTSHISSGSTPRGGSSVYKIEGIPLIRSQDVKMNNLDYSNIVYIGTEIHDKMKRSKLKNRDVLLNITGASIGRTAVFYGEDDSANTNQHVAAIRLKDEKVSPEFLSFYFSTEYFQAIIKNISSGGTREALNYKQIREFDIPLISKIKQEKFIKNKEKIEEEKKKLNSSLKELENLFDAFMQEAFSGNLFKD